MINSITSRRSIRSYTPQPVEDEKIHALIESARLAPSGSNTQPWQFIIVKEDEMRMKLATQSHNQQWMNEAPVYIVCIGDSSSRLDENNTVKWDENSPDPELKQIIRDTAIAIEHMVLTAEQLDLSTCWIAWFTQDDIRPVLNIPEDKYVIAILTIGYSDESPKPRPRKSFEEIVRYEKW